MTVKTFPPRTDPQLALYTSGRFIFRCMAGRKIKFNVQSVTEQQVDPGGGDGEFPFDITAASVPKHTVTTQAQLIAAMNDNTIGAGHVVTINQPADEIWAGPAGGFTFDKAIPVGGLPVIYKADVNQGVKISGLVRFTPHNTSAAVSSNQMLWGFKMIGPTAKVLLSGTGNRIQRFDISGWTGKAGPDLQAYALHVFKGSNLKAYLISIHDPEPYSAQEKAVGGGHDRFGLSCKQPAATFPKDCQFYGLLFYNFPNRPRPADYGSGQTDAIQPGEDVDQTSGVTPQFNCRWKYENILVEETHAQYTLPHAPDKPNVSATIDLKVPGAHIRNLTMLCIGKLDQRGGGLNVIENVYMEGCKGAGINGNDSRLENWIMKSGTVPVPQIDGGGTLTQNGTIGINMGNAEPTTKTPPDWPASDPPFYQHAEDITCIDIRGTVEVGHQYGQTVKPNILPANRTVLTRVSNPNILAATKQTNTVNNGGAPTSTTPVKLTRTECGHTATWTTPTLFDP